MEQSTKPLQGFIPGNTNAEFIYITGAIVSWWARIEGIMMHDIMALRTWPFSERIVKKDGFPMSGKSVVKHWRRLIENGYAHFSGEPPNLSKIVNEAIELMDHRNVLAHSFWPYGQEDPQKLELSWIKRDDGGKWGVSQGTYSATLADLDDVNTRLCRLYNAVMVASFNSHKLYHMEDTKDP